MATKFASRAWSCESLQRGMVLARAMPLNLDSVTETQLAEMEAELQKLQARVVGEGAINWAITKTHKRLHDKKFGRVVIVLASRLWSN